MVNVWIKIWAHVESDGSNTSGQVHVSSSITSVCELRRTAEDHRNPILIYNLIPALRSTEYADDVLLCSWWYVHSKDCDSETGWWTSEKLRLSERIFFHLITWPTCCQLTFDLFFCTAGLWHTFTAPSQLLGRVAAAKFHMSSDLSVKCLILSIYCVFCALLWIKYGFVGFADCCILFLFAVQPVSWLLELRF